MPKRHGNWLSENESHLVNLTLRVPPTTAEEVTELQERTGLCKRDVIKVAIRQLVQRQRELDAKRQPAPRRSGPFGLPRHPIFQPQSKRPHLKPALCSTPRAARAQRRGAHAQAQSAEHGERG